MDTFVVKQGTSKEILRNFLLHVENHFDTKVKTMRSDNGREILQSECGKVFTERGILHQRSLPGVPQQNGRVERKHRFLLETARAMELHANLPDYLCGECILAATQLINLLPTAVLNWKTPYERLMKKEPRYDHLRVIGSLCYARGRTKPKDKFATRGIRCILIGYPCCQKGYKSMDLESKRIFVSRDVVFHESILPFMLNKEKNEVELALRNTDHTIITHIGCDDDENTYQREETEEHDEVRNEKEVAAEPVS